MLPDNRTFVERNTDLSYRHCAYSSQCYDNNGYPEETTLNATLMCQNISRIGRVCLHDPAIACKIASDCPIDCCHCFGLPNNYFGICVLIAKHNDLKNRLPKLNNSPVKNIGKLSVLR